MALMDEFKEERETIKNKSTKEKVGYFWYYYKWRVILPIIIVFMAASFIKPILTRPEILLDGFFVNVDNYDENNSLNKLTDTFVEEQGLDPEKNIIAFNPNISYITEEQKAADEPVDTSVNKYAAQAVVAGLGSNALNFVIGPSDALMELDSNQLFADLSSILTEEQQALYESFYIYTEDTDPLPILLDVSNCEILQNAYGHTDTPLAIGIIHDRKEMDMMLEFVDYLMK